MRPGEILLSGMNVIGVFFVLFSGGLPLRAVRWVAVLPAVAAAVQIGWEGLRWQMVPAYLLALLIAGSAAWRPRRRAIRSSTAAGQATVLALAIALPIILPVFQFPAPNGPYGIGTTTYYWTDTHRHEIFSTDASATRELVAQVWYPTRGVESASRAHYVDDAGAISAAETSDLAAAGLVRLPRFFFDQFGQVTTNAVPAAPAATAHRFPVLVYTTGLDGYRQANTFQVESLVSHGYVVVGLDQPYTSVSVRFPDGRRVRGWPKPAMQPFIDQSIAPGSTVPLLQGTPLPDGIIPYLAQDVSFALDKLAELNRSDPILAGRLDLEHAGAFGVSLGAMVTAEACHLDARLRACLMMDAAMPSDVVESGLNQPAMWLTRDADSMRLERRRSGGWSETDIRQTLTTMRAVFAEIPPGRRFYVEIPGMFHINFTDAPYWSPLASQFGLTGPIDGQHGFDIINAYSLAFFDSSLRDRTAPLLTAPSSTFPTSTSSADGRNEFRITPAKKAVGPAPGTLTCKSETPDPRRVSSSFQNCGSADCEGRNRRRHNHTQPEVASGKGDLTPSSHHHDDGCHRHRGVDRNRCHRQPDSPWTPGHCHGSDAERDEHGGGDRHEHRHGPAPEIRIERQQHAHRDTGRHLQSADRHERHPRLLRCRRRLTGRLRRLYYPVFCCD